MTKLDYKYIRWGDNCASLEERDGLIILSSSQDQEKMVRLNMEGRDIWYLCDGTRTLKDIVDALEKEYDAPRSILKEDCEKLIKFGVERDILTLNEKKIPFSLFPYDLEDYVHWSEDAIWRVEEERLLIMDMRAGQIYSYPAESFFPIWKLFNGEYKIKEILDDGVSNALLRYFEKRGLIKILKWSDKEIDRKKVI